MNSKFNTKTTKKAFVSAITLCLVTLPLLASAADTGTGFFSIVKSPDNARSEDILYAKLKNASRDVCGSSNLQEAGSVERVVAHNECYEETLATAVERLNNPKVKELHLLSS